MRWGTSLPSVHRSLLDRRQERGMRRLVVLAIVSLLGIAPVGIVGRSASAQSSSTPQSASCPLINYPREGSEENPPSLSLPWEEVCRPIPGDATIAAPYQPYAVAFNPQYAAPEVIGDGTEDQRTVEFMIVR